MSWFVYILKSEAILEKIYIGSTNDVARRLRDHNQGNTPSTKRFIPWEVVLKEEYSSRREALIREKQLKRWKNRKRIESLIRAHSSVGRAPAF